MTRINQQRNELIVQRDVLLVRQCCLWSLSNIYIIFHVGLNCICCCIFWPGDFCKRDFKKNSNRVFFSSWFNKNNTFWCFHRGFNLCGFALRIAKKCQITHLIKCEFFLGRKTPIVFSYKMCFNNLYLQNKKICIYFYSIFEVSELNKHLTLNIELKKIELLFLYKYVDAFTCI